MPGKQSHFEQILGLVCYDNQLERAEVNIDIKSAQYRELSIEADRISEREITDFSIGEAKRVGYITKKIPCL